MKSNANHTIENSFSQLIDDIRIKLRKESNEEYRNFYEMLIGNIEVLSSRYTQVEDMKQNI